MKLFLFILCCFLNSLVYAQLHNSKTDKIVVYQLPQFSMSFLPVSCDDMLKHNRTREIKEIQHINKFEQVFKDSINFSLDTATRVVDTRLRIDFYTNNEIHKTVCWLGFNRVQIDGVVYNCSPKIEEFLVEEKLLFKVIMEETIQCDTIVNEIYNPFSDEINANFYMVNDIFLMPSDSISFKEEKEYCISFSKKNDKWNYKSIYFKKELLFRFEIKDDQYDGVGYCYYPFNSLVAIQAEFRKSKLHGLYMVNDEKGKTKEIMLFKNGEYKKHIFHYEFYSKKALNKYSKGYEFNKSFFKV